MHEDEMIAAANNELATQEFAELQLNRVEAKLVEKAEIPIDEISQLLDLILSFLERLLGICAENRLERFARKAKRRPRFRRRLVKRLARSSGNELSKTTAKALVDVLVESGPEEFEVLKQLREGR